MAGGKRPGAGRPKGRRNNRTVEQVEAVEQGGMTPLEFLLSVMRDEKRDFKDRIDAAGRAAPYCHPRLVAAVIEDKRDNPLAEVLDAIAERNRDRPGDYRIIDHQPNGKAH